MGSIDGFKLALIVVSAVAVLASVVEAVVLWRLNRPYDWREAGASLVVALGREFTNLLPLAIALPGGFWLYEHRLWTAPLDTAWGWVLLFLGVEFFYYWFHRGAHRIRWFWATHAVHHSSNRLNFSSAYRLGWTGRFTGILVYFVPLAWLGYPPQAIAAAFTINLLYQFWIHAEWIPRLGPLEGILNTPSAHRVHHGANLDYLDANYGGILMVFDRLFGTYVAERDDLKPRCGLVVPLQSYNPLRIAFFQWIAIAGDLRHARSLREIAGYLFGPPGWAPDGQGLTTENLRRRARSGRAEPLQELPPYPLPR